MAENQTDAIQAGQAPSETFEKLLKWAIMLAFGYQVIWPYLKGGEKGPVFDEDGEIIEAEPEVILTWGEYGMLWAWRLVKFSVFGAFFLSMMVYGIWANQEKMLYVPAQPI